MAIPEYMANSIVACNLFTHFKHGRSFSEVKLTPTNDGGSVVFGPYVIFFTYNKDRNTFKILEVA